MHRARDANVCHIIKFLVVGLSLLALVGFSLSCSHKRHPDYPVVGRDSLKDIAVFEDHSDALLRWMKKGIRGAVLINIDTHDDIRWIPDEKIQKLYNLYQKKAWTEIDRADSLGDDSLYGIGNFIYAAARLGIVRELYWVIPFAHFSTNNPLQRVKNFLKIYGFPEQSIRSFAYIDGCVRGNFYGIPVSVCGIEHLPEIREPVLLSFDIDYFEPMAFEYGVDRATSLRILMGAIFQRAYRVKDTVVAFSVNGGYLRDYHRWMGEAVIAMLKEPRLLSNPRPLWHTLSEIDALVKRGDTKMAETIIQTAMDRFGQKKALRAYLSRVYFQEGRPSEAYTTAKALCEEDRSYCYLLVGLGIELSQKDRPLEAERFLKFAYQRNPDIFYGQAHLGNAFRHKGMFQKAIEYYKLFKARNGSFPADFFIGQTYLLMGNTSMAQRYFDLGIEGLKKNPYVDVKNKEVSEALRAAVRFYEKKGLRTKAEAIRSDKRISDLLQ